jgi:hypothetical protein
VRIFVCEYITGGGLDGKPLPAGLARKGNLMLAALVKDLAPLPEDGGPVEAPAHHGRGPVAMGDGR